MALTESFKDFVLDQLMGLGEYESKRMFGGVALLSQGSAFAKIKHDKLWLKVDDSNRADFESRDMPQYTYGKDNSRRLNFYETPVEVLEDSDQLLAWSRKSIEVATRG